MTGLLDQMADGDQATQEEQAQYDSAIKLLEKLVLNSEMVDRLSKTILQAETPIQGIATVGAKLLVRIETKMPISDAVRTQLIEAVIAEAIEMASELEVINETDIDDQLMESLIMLGTEQYARLKEGGANAVNPEQQKQRLREMQQDGTLGRGLNAMSNDRATKMKELLGMMGV